MSLFVCPVCSLALEREEHGYRCPSGHCFDLAAQGYTHLLPVNRMHSRIPGDDAGMVAARSDFLNQGYYEPLLAELKQLCLRHTSALTSPAVLDCGCGEGWYTAGLLQAWKSSGQPVRLAGIDISKYALRRAARRCPDAEFAVASAYRLPVADDSIDLVLNVFAPLAIEELARILHPGGTFLYVVPAAHHLWQMKQILYKNPYENTEKQTPYPGFRYLDIVPVRASVTLKSQRDIHALFQMTPYYWKTPKEGSEALSRLNSLTTDIAFDIHIFQREDDSIV